MRTNFDNNLYFQKNLRYKVMNDWKEPEPLSDDFCNSLSSQKLMSLSESLAPDAKLQVLSGWMSAINSCGCACKPFDEIFEKGSRKSCVFHFLKSCLTADQNRYVTYTARKVITSLIKVYKSEDGIQLLQDILNGDGQLELICFGLQMCRELLSRKNLDHEFMVSQFGSSITKAWQILSKERINNVTYNQCLMEYFSVCIKLSKIVWSQVEPGESLTILQQILSSGDDLNIILFDDAVKQYAKKKLIRFLCFILRPCNLTHVKVLCSEIFAFSVTIFNKLWSSNIISILRIEGNTTFIGNVSSESGVSDKGLSCDTIHMRDWTFLCLCISSRLVLQQDYKDKALAFLLRLDDSMKELLDKQWASLFPWLPEIYGDQDDMWIDAMILLMDIFPRKKEQSSVVTEDMTNQHHSHFLQFAQTLGYDHLVLIDLLTSPETNCLTYLLKYLKFLLATWEYFKTLTSTCLKDNPAFDECSDAEKVYEDTANDSSTDIQVTDTDFLQDRSSEHAEEVKERITFTSTKDVKHVNAIVTNGTPPNHLGKSNLVPGTNADENYDSKLLASSSLMLIADAYDDDDEYDDDDDDDDECEMNMITTVDNDMGEDNVKTYSNKSIPVIETDEGKMTYFEQGLDISYEEKEDNSNKNIESRKHIPESSEDCDKIQCNLKKRDTYADKNLTDLDMDTGDNTTDDSVACDSAAGDSATNDNVAVNSILDTVMGMLIRTRMQLEKLTDSHLMKYNPTVVINLIASVEELYEDH